MLQFDQDLTAEQLAHSYPALLHQSGYRTGFIGKYGVGKPPGQDVFDFNRGFPGQGKFLIQPCWKNRPSDQRDGRAS